MGRRWCYCAPEDLRATLSGAKGREVTAQWRPEGGEWRAVPAGWVPVVPEPVAPRDGVLRRFLARVLARALPVEG